MARPTKKEAGLIAIRNQFIIRAQKEHGLSLADLAYVFRIPRNTAYTVTKK